MPYKIAAKTSMYMNEIMKFGINAFVVLVCNSASDKKLFAAFEGKNCRMFKRGDIAGSEVMKLVTEAEEAKILLPPYIIAICVSSEMELQINDTIIVIQITY